LKKRLFGQFFPSYLLIILIFLLMSILFTSKVLKQFYFNQVETDLKARAFLIEEQINKELLPKNYEYLNQLCKKLDKKTSMRVTIILPSGKVIADSEKSPSLMDNHKKRPEVITALAGQVGNSIRYSHTLKKNMMYVAAPVRQNQKIAGIIRVSVPLLFIDKVLKNIYLKIITEGLVVAVIAVFVSFLISRQISKPLEELGEGAEHFAKGDLKYKLAIPKTKEIGELALAMNEMAAQLDSKITQITQQSNELEVILSSLEEGVIAIDIHERIMKLNRVAAKLISVNLSDVQNRKIQEVIKNDNLRKFISKALSVKHHVKEEIIIHTNGKECIIHAYSTALQNIEGGNIGALIVLNDITQLKKLENIRRDFIANVSHELKTPITSIKGYAETLIDGALNNKETSEQFVNIILKQANRLGSIIEDLLSLSRLEQESRESEFDTKETKIIDFIKSAIQLCSIKAESKDIKIEFSCPEDIRASVNSLLMEQAIVNLIDNAVKYSPEKSRVLVETLLTDKEIVIKVIDQGCGISKEHLPRIFERFYRVDKARSRKLGGTGLGLAIVKHISRAHGGYSKVDSTVGTGSIFSIHLPFISVKNHSSQRQ